MPNNEKLNILVKVHEFGLNGSECLHAYSLLQRLSHLVNLTIIHSASNQFGDQAYTYSAKDFSSSTTFISVPYPYNIKWLIRINKHFKFFNSSIGLPPLYFFILRFWEFSVYRIIRKHSYRFDLIHSLNHISFREPGFLYKLPVKYIHGPISGLYNIPIAYGPDILIKIVLFFRLIINKSNQIFNLRLRKAIEKASVVFYVNPYDRFGKSSKFAYYPDVGVNISNISLPFKTAHKLQALIVGRGEWMKGYDIVLDTFRSNPYLHEKFDVHVFGDIKFKYIAKSEKFTLHGKVSNSQVIKQMQKSHLLIHMSLKEATSLSIIEALSNSCEVVCHAGFGIDNINSLNVHALEMLSRKHSIDCLKNFLTGYTYNFNSEQELHKYEYDYLAKKLLNYYEKNSNYS